MYSSFRELFDDKDAWKDFLDDILDCSGDKFGRIFANFDDTAGGVAGVGQVGNSFGDFEGAVLLEICGEVVPLLG